MRNYPTNYKHQNLPRSSQNLQNLHIISQKSPPPNLPSAQISQITPQMLSNPDNSSHSLESFAQGLPPVQVAPSVEHLHEGPLGEVTKGWDSNLTKSPPLPTPLEHPSWKPHTEQELQVLKDKADGTVGAPRCVMNSDGFCTTHLEQGKAVKISKQVWRDRIGGQDFGWVKTKAQKFICRKKNFGYADNTISTSDRYKPEMKGKTLTGIYKLNNDGVSIETSRTDYQEDSEIQR